MTDLRKAAEMALEVMEYNRANGTPNMGAAIEALRQALAQDSLRKLAEIDRELGLFDEPKQPEQEPETVMAKYEFQTYAAYKDGGEMKIGVVPEHTAWVTAGKHTVPLYTAPPKREWVGLTDDEVEQVCTQTWSFDPYVIARAIETKLKEKNT